VHRRRNQRKRKGVQCNHFLTRWREQEREGGMKKNRDSTWWVESGAGRGQEELVSVSLHSPSLLFASNLPPLLPSSDSAASSQHLLVPSKAPIVSEFALHLVGLLRTAKDNAPWSPPLRALKVAERGASHPLRSLLFQLVRLCLGTVSSHVVAEPVRVPSRDEESREGRGGRFEGREQRGRVGRRWQLREGVFGSLVDSCAS
jgi:hypothetical protein